MKTILLVEDDELSATALAHRLKSHRYSVTVAPDAVTAVESAVKLQPDLVLLDISMPAGDGFTVAERIQKLLPTETPIIFLTASRKSDLRERAKQLGAAGFFYKPFEMEDLIGSMELALAGELITAEPAVYSI